MTPLSVFFAHVAVWTSLFILFFWKPAAVRMRASDGYDNDKSK